MLGNHVNGVGQLVRIAGFSMPSGNALKRRNQVSHINCAATVQFDGKGPKARYQRQNQSVAANLLVV